ncbi:AGE family epimerase/isomerase [Microbacterium sp.]|uniref:AGE family epimerase/isomerase n=1 Tax=Microbacterium sp. TaxID=51671 RepID=UPI0033420B15
MPESGAHWGEHLVTTVLPWWERAVRPGGGVFTCYSNDGVRVSDDLYTWSQGRWAWLAAELAAEAEAGRLDVDAALWRRRAIETADLVNEHALLGDGTVAFRLGAGGEQLPSGPSGELATSVFADLFAALGLAGGIRMLDAGDPRRAEWRRQAELLLETAENSTQAGTALSEPYPVPAGYADLPAPMSLVHTASELLRAAPDSAMARGVRDRAWARLDADFLQTDAWWEFRPADPADAGTLLARHRTPGHLLELAWMLLHSGDEARGRADIGGTPPFAPDRLASLARRAIDIGEDRDRGGVLRYVDGDGGRPDGIRSSRPERYEELVERTWDTKLWWVHVESLYACALLAERTGDEALRAAAERIDDYVFRTFPDPGGAEWLQIRDRDGAPLDEVVALPVKDPFHIARSLLLLHRLAATDTASKRTNTGE